MSWRHESVWDFGWCGILPPKRRIGRKVKWECYFFSSASRCLISLSSSSVCCAIRSALRFSSSAPEAAAACSTSCRIFSRTIAMRSSSSGSESQLLLLIMFSPSQTLPSRAPLSSFKMRVICLAHRTARLPLASRAEYFSALQFVLTRMWPFGPSLHLDGPRMIGGRRPPRISEVGR